MMKQGSFRVVRSAVSHAAYRAVFLLIMFSLAVFSVYGDETAIDFLSVVIEDFNGETTKEWVYGGRTLVYQFDWAVDASRFATRTGTEVFPRLAYIPTWPMAAFGVNREGRDIRSLGINGRFDRRGYNWIDVYPIVPGSGADDEPIPFEIPIPGRLHSLDMWVWGSNHNFYLEVYLRDHQGVIHTLNMGTLAFQGWRNMRVNIPNHIQQGRRILPRFAGLHLVKFRIWTTPVERVDDFFVYFKQIKVLTDAFEALFDGDELADPIRIQELWAQN